MSPACQPRDEYLDGALSAEAAHAFEAHAQGCAECTKALASWTAAKGTLSAWAKTHDRAPTSNEVAELLQKAESPRSPFAAWLPRAAGFAAVAAAAAVAFVVLRPSQPKPFELSDTVAQVEILGDKVAVAPHSHAFVREVGPGQTRVALESGSVVSHVKHRQPGGYFIVEAGDTEVRVVGTLFQVERPKSDPLAVEVKEGRVEVWRGATKLVTLSAGDAWSDGGQVHPLDDATMRAMMSTLGEPLPSLAEVAKQTASAAVVDAGTLPEEEPAAESKEKPVAQTRLWTAACSAGGAAASKAEKELAAYLKSLPSDSDSWVLLGLCRNKQGKTPGAIEAFKRAIAVGTPVSANVARFELANTLQKQRAFKEAQEPLEAYLKQPKKARPLEAAAMYKLGELHFSAGENAEAKAMFEKVLKLHPKSPSAVQARNMLTQLP